MAGIRATSVSRTVVDLAALVDRPSLEAVVDDAFCQGLASPASVLRSLERVGSRRRGRTTLSSVLQVRAEPIDPVSPAEVRLLRALSAWGLRVRGGPARARRACACAVGLRVRRGPAEGRLRTR